MGQATATALHLRRSCQIDRYRMWLETSAEQDNLNQTCSKSPRSKSPPQWAGGNGCDNARIDPACFGKLGQLLAAPSLTLCDFLKLYIG